MENYLWNKKILNYVQVKCSTEQIQKKLKKLKEISWKILIFQVIVRLRELKHHAELSVEDTGIGIHPNDIGKIFEKFVRLNHTHRRSFEVKVHGIFSEFLWNFLGIFTGISQILHYLMIKVPCHFCEFFIAPDHFVVE
jgi:hypothetical protein